MVRYAQLTSDEGLETEPAVESAPTLITTPTPTPTPALITIKDAKAAYLGGRRSRRWWYARVEAGDLPHHRTPAGGVLLDPADCETFANDVLGAKMTAPPKEKGREIPPAPTPPPAKRPTRPSTTAFRHFPPK